MAKFYWVTCDLCNPSGETRRQDGRGIFEGLRDAAMDAGWKFKRFSTDPMMLSYDKKDICPECQDEAEQG